MESPDSNAGGYARLLRELRTLSELETPTCADLERIAELLTGIPAANPVQNRIIQDTERVRVALARLRLGPPPPGCPEPFRAIWSATQDQWFNQDDALTTALEQHRRQLEGEQREGGDLKARCERLELENQFLRTYLQLLDELVPRSGGTNR